MAYGETVPQPFRCRDETPTSHVSPGPPSGLAGGDRGRFGVRLAIDLGSARIGVARSDRDGLLASPLATIQRGDGDLDALADLAAADDVIEVVVGLPIGLSGREGRAAGEARTFAIRLAGRVAPVPVRLVDERFTTVIAHDALRRGGSDARARRPRVDQAAAALLLQGALDMERSTGQPAGELVGSASGGAT